MVTSFNWMGGTNDVYWFNNTAGDGSAWTRVTIGSNMMGYALDVGDIDDDGDNDTVISDYWNMGQVYWYENLNSVGTSWSSAHYIDLNPAFNRWPFSVNIGDIDNDGNLDVACLGDSELVWYEAPNNPTVSPWTIHSVVTVNTWGPYSDVYLGDMGTVIDPPDGNLDMVMCSYNDYYVGLFENDGSPTNGGWEQNYIDYQASNWTGFNNVFLGNIDNKDYLDIVATADWSNTLDCEWYQIDGFFPTNAELDVGNNGNQDWSGPIGIFNTSTTTSDITTELNNILSSATTIKPDEFGNEFVDVDLKVASDSPGIITMDGIDITYDYSTMVWLNPYTGTLAQEIEDLVFGLQIPEVNLPLDFYSESGGKLKVTDLFVEYNAFPKLSREVPSDRSVNEDSFDYELIDLTEYFTDDYLTPDQLKYDVIKNSKASIVDVFVTNGTLGNTPNYLAVDSLTRSENDDWFGSLIVTVNATDDEGLTVDSNDFTITINPVNDEPVRGTVKIPNITFYEGGISSSIFLGETYYFYDIEDDKLYFNYTIDPADTFFDEQLEINIDPITGELQVASVNDWWNGQNIPVRIYCDDDPEFEPGTNPFLDIFVNIINLNDDAPYWTAIPDVHILEDTPTYDAVELEDHVTDMDDDITDLIFSVISNSNPTKIKITLGTDNKLDIIPLEANFTGSSEINLRVKDASGNYNDHEFMVYVDPVNDPPMVIPFAPANEAVVNTLNVALVWTTVDADNSLSDISYDVYFGTKQPVQLKISDYQETSYDLTDLTDGSTYYWQVVPSDPESEGTFAGGVHSFEVDTSYQLPTTTLYSPLQGTEVLDSYIELSWAGNSPNNVPLTYDVYLDTNPTPTTLVSNNQESTSFLYTGLQDGMTYYWTVIPFDGNTKGACLSDVWNFNVNVKNYGVNVTISLTELTIRQGGKSTFEVIITNTGNNDDNIVPGLDAKRLGINIQLEDMGNVLSMSSKDSVILLLTLDIPESTAPKRYTITVSAISQMGGVSDSIDIDVNVLEKKDVKDKDADDGVGYTATIAVAAIIILAILFLLFMRKRKKEEEEAIEELVAADTAGAPQMPPAGGGMGVTPVMGQPQPAPQFMPPQQSTPMLPPAPAPEPVQQQPMGTGTGMGGVDPYYQQQQMMMPQQQQQEQQQPQSQGYVPPGDRYQNQEPI